MFRQRLQMPFLDVPHHEAVLEVEKDRKQQQGDEIEEDQAEQGVAQQCAIGDVTPPCGARLGGG